MKLGTLTEGDLVVMNDLPDATLFVVLDVDRFNVLIQEAGTDYRSEWQDICYLETPTKEQLAV